MPKKDTKPKEVTCPQCNGRKKIGTENCSKCKGKGTVTLLTD